MTPFLEKYGFKLIGGLVFILLLAGTVWAISGSFRSVPPVSNGSFVCGSSTVSGKSPDTAIYGTVLGADRKCWLDRNLGATKVSTSSSDAASYGWYYQWGRGTDGHQIGTSGTTSTLAVSDIPGHSSFIVPIILNNNLGSTSDWRSSPNDILWQGVSGTNNPCPIGWRLPTQSEWATLVKAASITNPATAYASTLKLPSAGARRGDSGNLRGQGSLGYYWSSSSDRPYSDESTAHVLVWMSADVDSGFNHHRSSGCSVRCLKD